MVGFGAQVGDAVVVLPDFNPGGGARIATSRADETAGKAVSSPARAAAVVRLLRRLSRSVVRGVGRPW